MGLRELKKELASLRTAIRSGRTTKQQTDAEFRRILKAQPGAISAAGRMTEYVGLGGRGGDAGGALNQVMKRMPSTALEYEFQKAADLFVFTRALYKAAGKPLHRTNSRVYHNLQKAARDLRKAMDTATAGEGLEWIPTELSRTLIEQVRLELRVAQLHDRIPMPTNPFEVPLQGTDISAFLASEALTDNTSTESEKIPAATPVTSKITFTAVKLAVRTVWSSEVDQDAIIAMGDFIRNQLAKALADAQEDATVNGDTQVTHQDSDVTAATDRRKAWDGYRRIALANALANEDGGNVAITLAQMRTVRKGMGKYGVNPSRLAWVVPISGHADLLSIAELETLDTYGPQATILTGEVARVDGIPVIVSEFAREDLNASGVEDGVTVDRTASYLVFRDGFWYGDRENLTTKSQEVIETDQLVAVTKQRLDFQPIQAQATEAIIGLLFNQAT